MNIEREPSQDSEKVHKPGLLLTAAGLAVSVAVIVVEYGRNFLFDDSRHPAISADQNRVNNNDTLAD